MNKNKIIFFLILFILNNCSFDSKTGIWDSVKDEEKRVSELEIENKKIISIEKVYSSSYTYNKEINLLKKIILSPAKKNLYWNTSNLNSQNFIGNIYLSGIDNIFLKKKLGKDKFDTLNPTSPLLAYNNNLIFSDDTGNIFNINENTYLNNELFYSHRRATHKKLLETGRMINIISFR